MNAATKPAESPFPSIRSFFTKPALTRRALMEPLTLSVEKIGRGKAGKTIAEWALGKAVVSHFLPSGLQLDSENPQEVAENLEKDHRLRQLLETDESLPTLEATPIEYILFQGASQRALLKTHEVIGQILTNTTRTSPPLWQQRYREYMTRLAEADVLWLMVPCPSANANGNDHDRFDADLRLLTAYARKALNLRGDDPCAVAIILTKVDALFETEQDARQCLSDDALRHHLSPLVTLVTNTESVHDAAIVPTSAFGFGNAVRMDPPASSEANAPANGSATAVDTESEARWIVPKGHLVSPFNLKTLMVWTLLNALKLKEVEEGSPQAHMLLSVMNHLQADLARIDGWLVDLKSQGEITASA